MPEKKHIIIKKYRRIKQIWLAEEYVINALGVSYDYLMKKRHVYKSWDFITVEGNRYYEYFSIPNRKPTYYRSFLPLYEDIMDIAESRQPVEDIYDYFEKALSDADTYINIYKDAPQEKRSSLCISASVIAQAVRYITETGYNTKKFDLFLDLAALVEQHNLSYIPYHPRRLKEKILLALAGTDLSEVIYLPRKGNSNAARFSDDLQLETWLYELQSNPRNFSDAYICRQIKRLCRLTDRPVPSDETIRLKLSQREAKFLTSVLRHGTGTREAAEYEGYIPVAEAPFAGDCWQIDATRVNMIAHEHIVTDASGNKIKSLQNIMVCVVRDVHSGTALGYSYDYAENAHMYINAIKMAVETSGYLPYELVTDKFPGHNTPRVIVFMETLQMMGVKLTVSHKATGKAQLERYFNTIQQIEMQGNDYYYGEGIRSKRKAAHVSPDYLASVKKKAKKEGFDLEQTITLYSAMLEAHNSRKYSEYSRKYRKLDKSPNDLHNESVKPNVIKLTDRQINHIFGIKTDVRMTANGLIKLEFRGVANYYLIDNYDIIEKYSQVCVSYNPDDMTKVQIYSRLKGTTWLQYLCTAEAWEKPMIYGPQAEFNKLASMKRRQCEIDKIREDKLSAKTSQLLESSGEEPVILESYDAEDEYLMGGHTYKKAANGFEDIELNPEEPNRNIYNQLFNKNL